MPILGAIVGAIFYAFIGYAAEFIAPNGNTEPDWFKLGATLIVGAIVGIVMYLGDIEVVSENVWMIMAQYAGAVYVVQKILIGIVSRFSPTVATMRAR
jgi:hypothetical protein